MSIAAYPPQSQTQSTLLGVHECPLCRSEQRRYVLGRWSDDLAVVRCSTCELVYASGKLDDDILTNDYYGSAAAPPRTLDRRRKLKSLRLFDRLVAGRLRRPPPGASALDIGCSVGALLDVLSDWGYETVGIERVGPAADLASRRHAVHPVDIMEPGLRLDRQFELITMTHVLEHLERPVAALDFVRRHLAPGGVAVIEVPNWGDLLRPLWGRTYRPLELGDHLSFFERRTLAQAIEASGLDLLSVWSQVEGATLVMPSVLSALDWGRKRLATGRAGRAASEVVSARGSARRRSSMGGRILQALDRLDPWLERVGGPLRRRGANLVAIAGHPKDGHQ